MLSKRSARLKSLSAITSTPSSISVSLSKPTPIMFQVYFDDVVRYQDVFKYLSNNTVNYQGFPGYPALENVINLKPFLPSNAQTLLLTDETIMCFAYSDDWGRYPFTQIGVPSGTRGYLFLTVPSVTEWNNKVYYKINRPYDDITGPAQITIITHASQINLLNNPDAIVNGPLSPFVIKQKTSWPFDNLIYDQDIYTVNVSESPLYFNDVVYYTAQKNSTVKIFDIIKTGLNSTTVPVSEFENIWSDATSTNNSIAEVDTTIYYYGFIPRKRSLDTILLKSSGTFVLNITQNFYQNPPNYNVGYKRKDFQITVNLTVF